MPSRHSGDSSVDVMVIVGGKAAFCICDGGCCDCNGTAGDPAIIVDGGR